MHSAVADAAVIGVYDQLAGERALAFLVKSEDASDTGADSRLKKELSKLVEEQLTEPHWLHDRIHFTDVIPRNTAGKVLRYKLRSQLAERQDRTNV